MDLYLYSGSKPAGGPVNPDPGPSSRGYLLDLSSPLCSSQPAQLPVPLSSFPDLTMGVLDHEP